MLSYYLQFSNAFLTDVTQGTELEGVPAQEKGDESIIGSQFVSPSVIRSLTLSEATEHGTLCGRCPATGL